MQTYKITFHCVVYWHDQYLYSMLTVYIDFKLSDPSKRGLCDRPSYTEQLIVPIDYKVFCLVIVKYVNTETEEELWFL